MKKHLLLVLAMYYTDVHAGTGIAPSSSDAEAPLTSTCEIIIIPPPQLPEKSEDPAALPDDFLLSALKQHALESLVQQEQLAPDNYDTYRTHILSAQTAEELDAVCNTI